MQIPKTHKAVGYDKPGDIIIRATELNTPAPGLSKILVKIYVKLLAAICTHSGVCHSDLSPMTNKVNFPFACPRQICVDAYFFFLPNFIASLVELALVKSGQVGGQEGVGVVAQLGPFNRVGFRWVASISGNCTPCLTDADEVSGYTPEVVLRFPRTSKRAGPELGIRWPLLGLAVRPKESFVKECCAEAFIDITKSSTGSRGIKDQILTIVGGIGATAAIVCSTNNAAYPLSFKEV
ncbi:secondary metabolism biosynthetic enzyme [Penicillium cinerascens]|uniref:Secondary metabolism biosynthetic enzyme n=1 Tax=Penicillium cinerascens TaxID=70096 RepID=A0A9W9J5T0_9EURO|nr:secondary metabolism biosynthetic enzyme [Penicillium cinerascens]KAJ5190865.1 secondary metabolism biosynthetic enzyme [Penicillium cinerascens]